MGKLPITCNMAHFPLTVTNSRKGSWMPNSFSHRILMEDRNRDAVISILIKYFDSFILVPQLGYWKGQEEPSISIEIIGAAYADVLKACKEIREANNQEAVLIFSVTGKTSVIA
jgi:hypothetical protein